MKLETQFTVPNKELKHLDYVKKVDFLKETLKKRMYRLSKSRRLLGLLQLKIKE